MDERRRLLAELKALLDSKTEVTEHNPWSERGQAWLAKATTALEQADPRLAREFGARAATIQVPLSSYTAGPIWSQMLLIIKGAIARLEREVALNTKGVDTFSHRTGLRREYSGPTEISTPLRTRLRTAMLHYLAEGEIGIGQEDLWVPSRELHYRLQKVLGKDIKLLEIFDSEEVGDIPDAVEIYLELAAEAASRQYRQILSEIAEVFELSGSVYYVDEHGRINLGIEPEAAERIERGRESLIVSPTARELFDVAVSGLLTRRAKPGDVVKDVFVALEEYLKRTTGERDFDAAVKELRQDGKITATQAQVLLRLQAYRSATFGTAHAGEERAPSEIDALWYIDTVSAQVALIDRVTRGSH